MADKLRIALSGIGNRALPKNPKNSNWFGWVELFKRSGQFDLVSAHDVADEPIKRLVERGYLASERTYYDCKARDCLFWCRVFLGS